MAQLQSLASIALLPTSTVCVFQVYLFSMRGACRKGFYHVTLRQRVSSAFVSSLLSSLHRRYPGLHARPSYHEVLCAFCICSFLFWLA